MDAPEADFDIKLQKISVDLIREFDTSLPNLVRKSEGKGGVRAHVRSREVDWLTGSLLDPFQELPQLLDPHLPKWIPFLSETYLEHLRTGHREKTKSSGRSKLLVSVGHAICKILYTFCKIRGEKVIVHFLNVEAKYLELLLAAFEEAEQHQQDGSTLSKWSWEQRYIVLLWLSHLLLAPFDLSTISSVEFEDVAIPEVPSLDLPKNLPGITLRVIPLAIKYLASPGKERDGAKALLTRMAMRRDMQQLGVLDSLVQWSLASLQHPKTDDPETVYYYLGILSFLAGILNSSSHTSDMNSFLPTIFHTVHGMSTAESGISKTIMSFALARKMMLKVIRLVIITLLRKPTQDMLSTEMTETSIEYLLESLSDNDTPVRLAASKSLSIITLKLDSDMASQVVEAVLESLNRNVLWKRSEGAKPVRDLAAVDHLEWHGLMLTLSHLLFRRSPPAEQLSDIIHALLLGLSFEQRSTSGTSVGANVRDAACFGTWALARRYTSEELLAVPSQSVFAAKAHPGASSVIQVLATELVVSGSLDSAGNIRRGASAALQELIGRHPDTIEKGIWVVQTVDYHSVARRSRAMEEVALGTAKLSSRYSEAILHGILGWRGIGDPDAASRRNAGASFGSLTAELFNSERGEAIPRFEASVEQLIEQIEALEPRQVDERHGLLLCLAAVLDQVPRLLRLVDRNTFNLTESPLVNKILPKVTTLLEEIKTVSSRRPELIAEAASRLVMSLVPLLQAAVLGNKCIDSLETTDQFFSKGDPSFYLGVVSGLESNPAEIPVVKGLMSTLGTALPLWLTRNEPETIEPASFAALVLLIFSGPSERDSTLESWATTVRNKPTSRTSSRGEGYFHTLALAQPLALSTEESDVACDAFLGRWAEDKEVETRVAILQSLTRCQILKHNAVVFLDMIAEGLNDYTTTARGDIGSQVRVQALKAVQAMWKNIDGMGDDLLPWMRLSVRILFYNVLRLSAEKLDRIRPEAQLALSFVMKKEHAEKFRNLTFSSQGYFHALLHLVDPQYLDPLMLTIILTDTVGWVPHLMTGFVTSADTGNEDLVISSRAALTEFCEASIQNLDTMCEALLMNLKSYQGTDRVIVPSLETVAFLFHVGVFQRNLPINMSILCLQTQKAGYKTGNVRKIEACIKVYGAIANVRVEGTENVVQQARKRLGALLFHPWPKVRAMVVDELWSVVGEQEGHGDDLLGIDWGKAPKDDIRSVVKMLRLE